MAALLITSAITAIPSLVLFNLYFSSQVRFTFFLGTPALYAAMSSTAGHKDNQFGIAIANVFLLTSLFRQLSGSITR
jgi:hypothetical protein